MVDDINWMSHDDHHETLPLEVMALYSGWITCESRIMLPYIPERVSQQFGYVKGIAKDPIDVAPPTDYHMDVDKIFAPYFNHVVLEDVQYVPAPHPWSTIYGYIQWFYRVTHTFMTLDAEGDPPRPAH